LVGGASASPALLREAADRGFPVLATYGLTEACSQVATQRPGETPDQPLRPLPGVGVRVVEGRIQVQGPMLFSGYLPESAWAAPFTADGWFETNDLGALDADGRLRIHGRADEVIVTGGEKVDPAEVEAVLEEHPAIAQALVFGIPDDTWGAAVAATLVLTPSVDRHSFDCSAFLAARLAPHKRPRAIATVDEIPTSPAGKPDRRAAARALVSGSAPGRTTGDRPVPRSQ
jgi:O-succinylbenzoic acid--CoA ligase